LSVQTPTTVTIAANSNTNTNLRSNQEYHQKTHQDQHSQQRRLTNPYYFPTLPTTTTSVNSPIDHTIGKSIDSNLLCFLSNLQHINIYDYNKTELHVLMEFTMFYHCTSEIYFKVGLYTLKKTIILYYRFFISQVFFKKYQHISLQNWYGKYKYFCKYWYDDIVKYTGSVSTVDPLQKAFMEAIIKRRRKAMTD
jgi:hypothetical protein